MKVIIAGSRGITDIRNVESAMQQAKIRVTEVVSGGARGVDRLGEEWAKVRGIPVKRFTPHWETQGKQAGFRRNEQMAKYADALVAIWDGESRGTRHMIDTARGRGLSVYVMEVRA